MKQVHLVLAFFALVSLRCDRTKESQPSIEELEASRTFANVIAQRDSIYQADSIRYAYEQASAKEEKASSAFKEEKVSVSMAPEQGSTKAWKLVGMIGRHHIVVIDKKASKDVYRLAIADLCGVRSWCKVMFWDDESLAPKKFPMTDAQVDGQVAGWIRNASTGLRRLRFFKNK